MASADLNDADRLLGQLPGAFFSTETAANCLGVSLDEARTLLAGMQCIDGAVRVCRDGWTLTLRRQDGRVPPPLTAYLDDMMRHLDVSYYLSYAAAARMHAVPPRGRGIVERAFVESDELGPLQLREAEGPAYRSVAFYRINSHHGRPSTLLDSHDRVPTGGGQNETAACTVRVATIETAILDMVEHPDRDIHIDHIANVMGKALFDKLIDAHRLAEASELYTPQVARRTGSMLQQVRGIQHLINLRPLWRSVRSRHIGPPIEIFSGEIDRTRKADRWGVTHSRRLDPDW